MTRTLIIGLDGATWDIIKPLAEEGKLPTLKKLMEEGVWGDLESTIPPITSPAWFSLATGLNPGKLGVFDFLSRKDNTYKLHPASSRDFQRKAIWDYVSTGDGDKKVGIVNYPMLFPPYEINGFMISGVGSSETSDITFPKSLKKKIDDIANKYEIVVNYHDKKYDDEDLYLKDVYRALEKRVKVIYHLMREEEWDLFISIFSCTDWTQHLMWKHIDKSHPLYDPKRSEKYKQEFIKFWMKIDDIVGNMIELVGESTNVFIVSDHGFGPQDECFNLGKWLEEKRYLIRKTKEKKVILKEKMKPVLSMAGKIGLGRVLPKRYTKKISDSFTTAGIIDQIDFEKSRAYVCGHTIPFGGIYLNVNGRDSQGCINNGSEYNALKREIIRELEDLRKDVKQDVEVSIFDPEEIYKGDKVKLAPDIIFTINNWRCIVNEENFDDVLFKNEPYSNRHTGSHRMKGIFAAHGPGIRNGVRINNAKIYDIAPTILYMFGVHIPIDMDGRVLKEIFKEDSELAKREIVYQEIDEKEKVRKRINKLKNLKRI